MHALKAEVRGYMSGDHQALCVLGEPLPRAVMLLLAQLMVAILLPAGTS